MKVDRQTLALIAAVLLQAMFPELFLKIGQFIAL